MSNPIEEPANLGELACIRNAQTGDYSLSLDGAIAELTAANRRLQNTIDDLLNKIECLRCGNDKQELGIA